MATQLVSISGEQSVLALRATNITGPDPLDIISGSFRASPDERRVCSAFFGIGAGTIELRFEFTDYSFPIRDWKGQIKQTDSATAAQV